MLSGPGATGDTTLALGVAGRPRHRLRGVAMEPTYGSATGMRDLPVIAQRMDAILRDEIQGGALANIASATRTWAVHRGDLALPEATRRLATEVSGVLGTVLDLIAPMTLPAADPPAPPASGAEHPVESVPVLRARRPGVPGGRAEIRTAVANDGAAPVEIGFRWSDLVGEQGGRIAAACLRFQPARLSVPPGALADLVIDLDVPRDTVPGLYHSLLRTTDRGGSAAVLVFRVGSQDRPEVAVAG
jgi:hypothetical protein